MKLTYLILGAIAITFSACKNSGGNSPEKATEMYVSLIAKAEYDKAMEISTGPATETVEQMKETDTKGYETKIVEVKCEVDNEAETAKCKCTERRIDSSAVLNYKYDSFVYELEKLDGKWKVSSQTKDMPMPDMSDMGFGDDDMMDEAPIEPILEDAIESTDDNQ